MRDYAELQTRLLADLSITDPAEPLSSDMSSQRVARLLLSRSFYKKLAPFGSPQADQNALEKFCATNDRVGAFEGFAATNEVESLFYDYFKDNFRKSLDPGEGPLAFDLSWIRETMDVGPGSNQKSDSRHMVSKLFESSISYVNPHLVTLYRGALVETGLWADAEMQRFHRFGFTRVDGGKLFFAPKNAEISRTCCTEPLLEMLFQKAVGAFIEARLARHFGIRLDMQPSLNRELARLGSIDGSFATIDLASASDSISLVLIRDLMKDDFLKAVLLGSSMRTAVLPDGRQIKLSMVSTMGNGFTFPLQTLIFACAVRACYQLMDLPSDNPRTQFGVFGDDIIVHRNVYDFICRMLTKLGFEVNRDKSYGAGLFRESCGGDYFAGVNVRGVYVTSLESPQQVISLVNRLLRWSAAHGVPLWRTLSRLKTWHREILVPPSETDDAGVKVPFRATRPRVNDAYWFKYRCFRPVSRKSYFDENVRVPDLAPSVSLGVGCGFLAGRLRRPDRLLEDGKPFVPPWDSRLVFAVRRPPSEAIRYRTATRAIPYWDWIPAWEHEWCEWLTPLSRVLWEESALAYVSLQAS